MSETMKETLETPPTKNLLIKNLLAFWLQPTFDADADVDVVSQKDES